jgi:hypothetical protein
LVSRPKDAQSSPRAIGENLTGQSEESAKANERIMEAAAAIQGQTEDQGKSLERTTAVPRNASEGPGGLNTLILDQNKAITASSASVEEMSDAIGAVAVAMREMKERFGSLVLVADEGNIITMEYVHRGVAYRIRTDQRGNISFPRGDYVMRTIGYIKGHDPQVISADFSSDRTAAGVDWRKVWDPKTPSGRPVDSGSDAKTGPVQNDYGDMMAMFNWDGTLEVRFEDSVLTIKGVLRPVKR